VNLASEKFNVVNNQAELSIARAYSVLCFGALLLPCKITFGEPTRFLLELPET
jgi:hypothetical protein